MARHRSPRGRRAHQSPPLVALGRTVAGEIVRRTAPVPTPLRRGAAAVAVTGGALSLAGVAATIPVQLDGAPVDPGVVAAAARAAGGTDGADTAGSGGGHRAVRRRRRTALVPGAAPSRRPSTPRSWTRPSWSRRCSWPSGRPPATVPDRADARAPRRRDADGAADETAEREDATAPATGRPTAKRPTSRRPRRAEARSTDCGLDTSQLGAVKSHVRSAANFLGCQLRRADRARGGRPGRHLGPPVRQGARLHGRPGHRQRARRLRAARPGGARRLLRDLAAADQLRQRLEADGGPRRRHRQPLRPRARLVRVRRRGPTEQPADPVRSAALHGWPRGPFRSPPPARRDRRGRRRGVGLHGCTVPASTTA